MNIQPVNADQNPTITKLAKAPTPKARRKAPAKPRKSAISHGLSCERASATRVSSNSHGKSGPPSAGINYAPHRKLTRHLGKAEVENILAAAQHACRIGLPFNRFITLSWHIGKVTDHVAATSHYLKLARDFLQSHEHDTAYVWTRECGRTVGEHVHILIHVPPHFIKLFSKRQRRWPKLCGAKQGKGTVKTLPIGRSYSAALSTGISAEVYQINLRRVVEYLVKDAEPKARVHLTDAKNTYGSPVHGKRSATSQNIGAKARQTWAAAQAQHHGQ